MTTDRNPIWNIGTLEREASEMYRSGTSAAKIAAWIGRGITKNQVLRRMVTLKIPSGFTAKQKALGRIHNPPRLAKARDAVSKPAVAERIVATETERTAYDATPALDAADQPFTIRTITGNRCRWIIGEPSADAIMCGHPTKLEKTLCPHHASRSYQPQHTHRGRP